MKNSALVWLAFVASLTLVLSVSTSALAATVTAERGEILVNHGNGYKPVTAPTEVGVGGQVMAAPKGSGRVVFPDGCAVKVEPNAILTITAQSPCLPRGSHVETGGSLKDDPVPEQRDDRRYLLRGLLIGGAIGAGVLLLRDKDNPSSP